MGTKKLLSEILKQEIDKSILEGLGEVDSSALEMLEDIVKTNMQEYLSELEDRFQTKIDRESGGMSNKKIHETDNI